MKWTFSALLALLVATFLFGYAVGWTEGERKAKGDCDKLCRQIEQLEWVVAIQKVHLQLRDNGVLQ